MTRLVLRSGWRALTPGHVSKHLERVDGLAIHHSGASKDERDYHLECHEVVRAIQHEHMAIRGWADIAYSFLVCRHDVVFEGRGWNVRPASQGTDDGNAHYLSACVLGHGGHGFLSRSRHALWALEYVRSGLLQRVPSATEVRSHSTFHETECPGDELRDWTNRQYRSRGVAPSPVDNWGRR